MKIYRIDWTDPTEGHCVGWAGSIAEAKRTVAEVKHESVAEDIGIRQVDFPTRKHDLLHWLNIYVTRDNG